MSITVKNTTENLVSKYKVFITIVLLCLVVNRLIQYKVKCNNKNIITIHFSPYYTAGQYIFLTGFFMEMLIVYCMIFTTNNFWTYDVIVFIVLLLYNYILDGIIESLKHEIKLHDVK